ncbi:MAG: hypothetical protein HYZ42_05290 [Bacteroidetes bacterium]|nr:hypothetical protein [Bacteroidota bacterium]
MFFGSFKHDIKIAPIAPVTPISSNPENKKMILETLDDIYNFDFAVAETNISKVKHKLPNHPIYHMLLTMNLDWQWEPTCEDKGKQALIIYHLNRTLIESDSLLRKKPNDLEVMFIQFTAHGFLARVNAILGNYGEAVNHSMSAYNSVKKGFDLKEKFYDFYFSTGMYNYYREKYPELHPIVKPFAAMLSDGNPELGIKQIRFSYAHSLFSKIESANYLINIFYKYESKPADAFNIAEEVNKKYPSNLFFTVKYAEGIMVCNKNKADYVALYEKLLESNSTYYQMCGYFFKAQKLYSENKTEDAFIWAHKSSKMSEKLTKLKDNMPSYIHMLLGKIYEKKGNSKEAEKCFKVAS